MYSLKHLSIKTVSETAIVGAAGEYNVGSTCIEILFNAEEETIYHELTHFIDDRLNKSGSGMATIEIYKYLNNYISQNELGNLSKTNQKDVEYVGGVKFDFLVEGGAEYNTGIYLTNMITYSYPNQVSLYNMFSYIYGSEFMNVVFFGREGQDLLFRKFRDGGYNYDEIEKFAGSTSRDKINTISSRDRIYCIDMLISLYEKEKDSNWYEDEIFSYFVSNMLPDNFNKTDTDRYDEYKKIEDYSYNINKKIREKLGNNKYDYIYSSLYFNDNIYIPVYAPRVIDGELRHQIKIIIYDFEKDEIKDYKIIEE